MTFAVLAMLIGLVIWLIFTKWTKVADAWVARVGEIVFAFAYLAYMLSVASKAVL